jgi:UDP-N-acetylmuramoyl-L-alanyl-D-glutamate--2,6-diaminopimelate ligase
MKKTAVTGDTSLEITGVTKDSRSVSEGSLFFVTSASSAYMDDALKRGARAVVTDGDIDRPFTCVVRVEDVPRALGEAASKFYGRPSRRMHVTGITGTNGKTTTTYLIEAILDAAGKKPGVIGTISYRYAGRTLAAPTPHPAPARRTRSFVTCSTRG